MVDILLIQPPISDFYITAKRTIPYGLTSIAAALQQEGFTVRLFDALATTKSKNIHLPDEMSYLKDFFGRPDLSPFSLFHRFRHFGYSDEHIGNVAQESNPFLVGISSLFTAYAEEALKCAEIVKASIPECKVVLGGHHPTAMPETVMENKSVNFVLRGEGEVSMPMLAKHLRNGHPINQVPGIVFRKKGGSLHISQPAWIDDIDKYPLPAVALVNHSFYKRKNRESITIAASRGCPMKCSYCCLGSAAVKYRRRSNRFIMMEIQTSVDMYNVSFINFEDENLSHDRGEFLKLMREIGLRYGGHKVELRAMNGLMPASLDKEMICAMKEAGFKTLNLSLGTTSMNQQKKFQRPDLTDSIDRALIHAESLGLTAVCYIIVGAPGQKAWDSVADLLYLAGKRTLAGVSVFYPSPGSADFEKCRSLQILPGHFSLMRSTAFPVSHTTSRIESVTLLRLGRILNFIKSLMDQKIPLPDPTPYKNTGLVDIGSRNEAGIKLLQWFLHDGKIRGLTPDNEVYEHKISSGIAGMFIQELKNIKVRGLKI